MIQLTRKHIRAIRSTIRQSLGITSARKAPTITIYATPTELVIQATNKRIAVECRLPGHFQPERFAIPYEALTTSEGKHDDLVSFNKRDDTVVLEWSDAGIPQSAQFSATEPADMPSVPTTLTALDSRFLTAMAEAMATLDSESTRYALDCIRLRGRDGQVAATNTCQALIETGFAFPWEDEILVVGSGAFTCSDFVSVDELLIGRSTDWVTLQAKPWTLHLRIEKERRFPNIDLLIPTNGAASTTLSLAEDDIAFLLNSTNRLPGASEQHSPVTVDLNGVVAIRAIAADQTSPTELVLSNSKWSGDKLRCNMNRDFLTRAAALGFRNICLRGDRAPAYCQDDCRTYIWALLEEEGTLKGNGNTTQIHSAVTSTSHITSTRTISPMTTSQPAATRIVTTSPAVRAAAPATPASSEPEPIPGLLTQAETLRDSLSRALSDTRDLITCIKRNQKQNRLVETTLRSLKQLEHMGA